MMINAQPQNRFTRHEVEQFGLFSGSHPVPLKSTAFSGQLKGMMTRMTMELVFENREEESIEAVYTFPVPDGAVFLGLRLEMAGQVYATVVMERQQATESYEESVTDGHAAILVEEVSPGLYSMQIGNIPPQIEVRIEYEYSLLHEWRDGLLRWRLPTVLAPRYGHSGLAPHHEPEVELFTRHDFSFELLVEGFLSELPCVSPTHRLQVLREGEALKLTLGDEPDVLDRDLVLHFQQDSRAEPEIINALWDRDMEGQYCTLLSLCTPTQFDVSEEPKTIKILIDCSGSMTGESIRQARTALMQIMQEIRAQDKVMIWKFGSSIEKLHNKPVSVGQVGENIFQRIQADLGGTDLYSAMMAMAEEGNRSRGQKSDVFLITDGELWNREATYRALIEALGSDQRVFSVGVGRAVSSEILNKLATDTGGAVELVTPDEKMAARVTSHFKRLYAPKINLLNIRWPETPVYTDQYPVIFSGDTAYIGARFRHKPQGKISVKATYSNGRVHDWRCLLNELPYSLTEEAPSVLARTIAARQMARAEPQKSLELALAYQLLSEQTACYVQVRLARNLQSDGQPALRKVPGMLAAGYGGLGSHQVAYSRMDSESCEIGMAVADEVDSFSEPKFCLRSSEESVVLNEKSYADYEAGKSTSAEGDLILSRVESFYNSKNRLPVNKAELRECGLEEAWIDELLSGFETEEETAHAIAVYLYARLQKSSELLSKNFSREIRIIAKLVGGLIQVSHPG